MKRAKKSPCSELFKIFYSSIFPDLNYIGHQRWLEVLQVHLVFHYICCMFCVIIAEAMADHNMYNVAGNIEKDNSMIITVLSKGNIIYLKFYYIGG